MTGLERNARPIPGPRFERVDGEVLFTFVIDGGSIIGPRPATDADRENHAGAWREFATADVAPEAVEPEPELVAEVIIPPDLDGDGKPGGSLPEAEDPDAEKKAALQADLKALGIKFHHKNGVDTLTKLLEDATAPKAD
jgi:hypothetical protein